MTLQLDTQDKRISDLEQQVKRLTDLQEIHQLKYRYFYIIDHFRSGEIGDVFTRDGTATMGPYGALDGRDELNRFFDERVFPHFELILHAGHHPMIEFTSDTTARGTWMYEVYEITRESSPKGIWLCGLYQDEYRIEDGKWLISSLSGSYYFNNTSRDVPWVHERFSAYPPGAPDLPAEFRIFRQD